MFLSECGWAQWRTNAFWFGILIAIVLWFVRLYVHYCGQWLFLQVWLNQIFKFDRIEKEYPVLNCSTKLQFETPGGLTDPAQIGLYLDKNMDELTGYT